jgi:hypothetical protein
MRQAPESRSHNFVETGRGKPVAAMSHLRVERRLGAEQNRVQLLHGRAQRHLRLHTAMKEVATRDEKGFGWEVPLTGPLRDARRFPSTRWCPVPGTTRTTPGFEICPSFNCQFLSPCQTSELRFATFCIAVVGRSDRQRADRCVRVRVGVSGVATSRVLGTRRWRLSNPILRFVVSSGAGGEQQSGATPQAARGQARPPCRHFKTQSCARLGFVFEVAALPNPPTRSARDRSCIWCTHGHRAMKKLRIVRLGFGTS